MNAPCMDCDHREPHCHSNCPQYREFREELEGKAAAREEKRRATPEICQRVVRQIYREMKRK